MQHVLGIHHVTAIATDPQKNIDFYAGLLGLRFIKQTVNFDDPGTYHLYYGDATGRPGTAMTFFPWPGARRGRAGVGQAAVTQFAIASGALGYWLERLVQHGIAYEGPIKRFGNETVLSFHDHDGLLLELVATDAAAVLPGWDGVVPEPMSIRGFHANTLWVSTLEPTANVLINLLGFHKIARDETTTRFGVGAGGPGELVDVRVIPGFLPGMGGAGTVHHVAFRAGDDAAEHTLRAQIVAGGLHITEQIDRTYFHSMYFREPGHVLFELATDAPGFAVDEPVALLGSSLQLPPQYEPMRAAIAARLPEIRVPGAQVSA
jgi:glyoxalase family protein